LLARFPDEDRPTMTTPFDETEPALAAMMFAWLAVDWMRQMTVLASHGHHYWTEQQFAFFFLEIAVVSAPR
jgi:hypothetical protein